MKVINSSKAALLVAIVSCGTIRSLLYKTPYYCTQYDYRPLFLVLVLIFLASYSGFFHKPNSAL